MTINKTNLVKFGIIDKVKFMSESKKYNILTAIRYLGDSFYYPFISLYLSSCGLTEANIGFILSITPLIGIIMNPLFSKFCINPNRTRNVLKVITCIEAIIILFIAHNTNFYIISALVLLLAISGSCHYGLMDSLFAIYAKQNNIKFSKIRIWGSIAYVLGTSFGGTLINLTSFRVCFLIASLLFIISGFLYNSLKPLKVQSESNQEVIEKPKYKELLHYKEYLIFALFYVIFIAMMNASDYFFPVYLKTRGINSGTYGLVYAYYVLVEVLMLFIFNRLKKKPNREVFLLIAAVVLTLRQVVHFINAPVLLIMIVSAARGFSWSIIIYFAYVYVVEILGERLGTIGIMAMTFVHSLLLVLLNNVNGVLIEKSGYSTFYLLMIVLGSLAIVVQIIRMITLKKSNKKDTIEVV